MKWKCLWHVKRIKEIILLEICCIIIKCTVIREASVVASTRWWGEAHPGCFGRSPSRSGSSSRSGEGPGTGCLSQSPENRTECFHMIPQNFTSPAPNQHQQKVFYFRKTCEQNRVQDLILIVCKKIWNFLDFRCIAKGHIFTQAHRACTTETK